MNKGSALKWIELLESGKYKLGTGALRSNGDEFCALGVLCDFIDNSKWSEIPLVGCYSWDGFIAIIPEEVKEKCKMKTYCHEVSNLNDNVRDFTKVAKFIRENYERL